MAPIFGDHLLLIIKVQVKRQLNKLPYLKRDWRRYSITNLLSRLNNIRWDLNIDDVQSYWNSFETKLVEVIDEIAPLSPTINNITLNKYTSATIKNKINLRKRLLKNLKNYPSQILKMRIKNLN